LNLLINSPVTKPHAVTLRRGPHRTGGRLSCGGITYFAKQTWTAASAKRSANSGRGNTLNSLHSNFLYVSTDDSLLLPSSAEGLVELDKRKALVELRVDKVQFCREIVGFVGQYLKIAGAAILVEDRRELI
jgi:hypothetical protein